MLNDGTGLKKIYLAMGFTDLRRGIDDLANIVRFHFHLDPYDKNTLFLFLWQTERPDQSLAQGRRWLSAFV